MCTAVCLPQIPLCMLDVEYHNMLPPQDMSCILSASQLEFSKRAVTSGKEWDKTDLQAV